MGGGKRQYGKISDPGNDSSSGSVVLVCVTAGASTPVIVGAASTAVLAGAGTVATDYIRGSVGEFDDYVNAVANAELMFLTNMAATKVIQAAGLGYGAGLALREGSMAAVGAMQQLATDGKLDYGELAMNLVINTVVDVGMDAVTGSFPGGIKSEQGAAGIPLKNVHGGKGELCYEEIIRALRESDSTEGHAVAKLLKRGKINVILADRFYDGRGGNGVQGNLGRTAEEMAVKQWLLDYSSLLGFDDATKELLKNQIEQLGKYGIKYGY